MPFVDIHDMGSTLDPAITFVRSFVARMQNKLVSTRWLVQQCLGRKNGSLCTVGGINDDLVGKWIFCAVHGLLLMLPWLFFVDFDNERLLICEN